VKILRQIVRLWKDNCIASVMIKREKQPEKRRDEERDLPETDSEVVEG
jgi:hypothetical protein